MHNEGNETFNNEYLNIASGNLGYESLGSVVELIGTTNENERTTFRVLQRKKILPLIF